jgi:hypothetical protein
LEVNAKTKQNWFVHGFNEWAEDYVNLEPRASSEFKTQWAINNLELGHPGNIAPQNIYQ